MGVYVEFRNIALIWVWIIAEAKCHCGIDTLKVVAFNDHDFSPQ